MLGKKLKCKESTKKAEKENRCIKKCQQNFSEDWKSSENSLKLENAGEKIKNVRKGQEKILMVKKSLKINSANLKLLGKKQKHQKMSAKIFQKVEQVRKNSLKPKTVGKNPE